MSLYSFGERTSWITVTAIGALAVLFAAAGCGGGDDTDEPGSGSATGGAAGTGGVTGGGDGGVSGGNGDGGSTSGSGGGSNGGGTSGGGTGGGNFEPPDENPPELSPKILLSTYIGGTGDQRITSLEIKDDGSIVAGGDGFSVEYDAALTAGTVTGDIATANTAGLSDYADPPLYKEWNNKWDPHKNAKAVDDPRNGLTYFMGTMQVANNLQQPMFVSCPTGTACDRRNDLGNLEFRLWGWWNSLCQDLSLMADSRGYDTWLMPNGLVGVLLYSDGGNTTLNRNPLRTEENCADAASCQLIKENLKDMGVTSGTWQDSADGPVALYMSIDPAKDGAPVRGTFLRGRATRFATDAWGRVYVPRTADRQFSNAAATNPLGQSEEAKSGLFVLGTDFSTVLHIRIGGTCDGNNQKFGRVVLKDNLLVMGGTTCATDLSTTPNAVQATLGGDHDAMLVVLQLW